MKFTRYALYYVPPPDADWARFATSWLGWDMQTGQKVAHPRLADLPVDLPKTTRAAQRYGLHATLKPPFRLAQGADQGDLESACASLCQSQSAFALGALRLTRLGRFLALCPPQSARLSAFGAACVCDLDHFRAPATPREIDRRKPDTLTPRQQAHLSRWGYPHVLEDFRFHITLTGRLAPPDLSAAQSALQRHLTPLLTPQLCLTNLALTGEDADGRFHLIRRFDLRAANMG